jgi:phosphoribosylanthranilate isomerase
MLSFQIKICGITKPDQGRAIANLGATALGFICVPQSPRYVSPTQIRMIVNELPQSSNSIQLVDRVGVFVNAALEEIEQVVAIANLNAVQLHGNESPQFCQELRMSLTGVQIIKALRVRSWETLEQANIYNGLIDTLLLDAYHPNVLGGTGKTLDWKRLRNFSPPCPWILAGGITPDNVLQALSQVNPDGIDLSSGVEHAPGDKDLDQVAHLFNQLSQAISR